MNVGITISELCKSSSSFATVLLQPWELTSNNFSLQSHPMLSLWLWPQQTQDSHLYSPPFLCCSSGCVTRNATLDRKTTPCLRVFHFTALLKLAVNTLVYEFCLQCTFFSWAAAGMKHSNESGMRTQYCEDGGQWHAGWYFISVPTSWKEP